MTLYLFSSKADEDFLPPLQPQQLESWHHSPATTHQATAAAFILSSRKTARISLKHGKVPAQFRRDMGHYSCVLPLWNIYLSELPLLLTHI